VFCSLPYANEGVLIKKIKKVFPRQPETIEVAKEARDVGNFIRNYEHRSFEIKKPNLN
jgi:hypothetical protein